jgi:hypothetical protein
MRGRLAASVLLLASIALLAFSAAAAAGNGHGNPGHGKPAKPAKGSAGHGNSSAAHSCQKGGYRSLVGADGTTFKNVGACVSFRAHKGMFATGMIIPAGKTATLSNAMFGDFTTNCPGDQLIYGYQLNLGANVQVATGGAGCQHVAGAVIGPFPTATLLRIWLTDLTPPGPYTFYSDSATHSLVTGANPFVVSINDSFFGQRGPTVTYLPTGPGRGNLNVTVTIT